MSLQQTIETKLKKLTPHYLLVENESYKHNVPPESEMHFKVTIVCEQFENKRLLERHRLINDALREELAQGLHALTLQTHTPAEWEKKQGVIKSSPPCLGGSKHDKKE